VVVGRCRIRERLVVADTSVSCEWIHTVPVFTAAVFTAAVVTVPVVVRESLAEAVFAV